MRSGPWTARTTVALLYMAQRPPVRLGILYLPLVRCVYRVFSLAVAGIDLPRETRVGRNLTIHHGFGLVVNPATIIGDDVTLRHNTTLGARYGSMDAPTLEAGVDVGPNVVIIGAITLGRGTVVAAGTTVLHGTPAGSVVVGHSGRLIDGPERRLTT
jgi:serine acetyltransferase